MELMKELDSTTVESSELVEQTFLFWLNDHGHIRSPFPNYIHNELKQKATERFYDWVNSLKPEAKDELNDEGVGEKFEEIIFDTASAMIKTEDERITILYQFLPRLGDSLSNDDGEESEIVDRSIVKEGDTNLLKVVCTKRNDGEKWSTTFALPI